MGVARTFLLLSIFSLVFLSLWETEILSQRAIKPKTTNQPNPVVSGMRTQVYNCYHIYSKVSNKNACRSIHNDLTTHSMIPDSHSRRFVVA